MKRKQLPDLNGPEIDAEIIRVELRLAQLRRLKELKGTPPPKKQRKPRTPKAAVGWHAPAPVGETV